MRHVNVYASSFTRFTLKNKKRLIVPLGSNITDANGHFRIDYTSKSFKQTFLSPHLNIETEKGNPFIFQSGPNVYFKYEYNGAAIQGETASNRRKNVGYCLCVTLCLKN